MKHSKTDFIRDLTWSEIQDWAGRTIAVRGQEYQRGQKVDDIACTRDGAVIAWVKGTERYATKIDVENNDELVSFCTCPYDDTCKHAVAVLLEYRECLTHNVELPIVAEDDRRLEMLADDDDNEWDDDQDEEEDERDDEEDEEDDEISVRLPHKTAPDPLLRYLKKQSKEELLSLIELAVRNPDVREMLEDRYHLSTGAVTSLVSATRKEIDKLSAEPGWTDHWHSRGNIPDYSGVQDRLEMLLKAGYADEVIALGKRLLESGNRQVEEGDDEGETQEEIASCLDVVFEALPKSSLPPAEQMLWAVEAELNDDYDLCRGSETFWEYEHKTADWKILAEKLLGRLNASNPVEDEHGYSRDYKRDRLTNWIITALENANRQDEIIPFCEQEALKTGNYVRLVDRLQTAGRNEEAEQWARKGIENSRGKWPGIAGSLREILRGMREQESDWLAAAAFRGDNFFANPGLANFDELQKSSERAAVWPAVRAAAMYYLESGELPAKGERKTGDSIIPPWPLPETGVRKDLKERSIAFPAFGALIDIAISEKKPAEVVRWHDHPGNKRVGWGRPSEDMIAKAIVKEYPERAVAIWEKLAEDLIAQTQPAAYETAAGHLENARLTMLDMGREEEWLNYFTRLRLANKRKRKLMEILDGLM